ncbi:hypothetical protein CEXT_751331 [Caerostris extrusa]|uniref:Uncharacterized protein n=1 Tax=Caerostris extrusa TaxID=172846 RepID=A0AAV4W5E8_CAEEX|nr:hypothetical protein CEXT_751331 [Caerostris extrusa]
MFQSIANKYNQIKYKSGKLSLEQEITLFLKSYKMIGKATVNGLQYLCRQLKTRQTELLEMLNSIKIQKAASDCMGALVIATLLTARDATDIITQFLLPFAYKRSWLREQLILFDPERIDVKVMTSEILKELFGTRTAYTFFIDYQALYPNNHIKKYAIPFFSCQNANNLKSVCQYEYKVEDIQDLSVWIPITSEHFEWITNLVCTLIESGLTKDNFYECLIPLCRKQVQFSEKILPYVIHAILLKKSLRSDHSSDHSDSSDTYSKIGDSDAISGCEVVATDSQAILKHTYLTEKKWDGLLKISDLNNSTLEIYRLLQQNNLNSVLQGYIQSLIHTQDEKLLDNIREYRCEAAWRMGQWDLPMPKRFQECLYKCQQSLISENSVVFEKYFKSAQKTQFEYLRHTSLEAARNVFTCLESYSDALYIGRFF